MSDIPMWHCECGHHIPSHIIACRACGGVKPKFGIKKEEQTREEITGKKSRSAKEAMSKADRIKFHEERTDAGSFVQSTMHKKGESKCSKQK